MLPVIFRFGNIVFYTYGVFLVMALFWFLYVAWKLLKITPHKEEELFDKIFLSLGVGLIVGRLAYILFNPEIVSKKGALAALAVHLYPGFHGLTILLVSFVTLHIIVRNKKYTGGELVAYLIPAACIALAIINLGAVFSGTVIGAVTDFPIRVKYALYDGLRHVPSLYLAIVYAVAAYVYYRLLLVARQGKVTHVLIAGSFLWLTAIANMLTLPMQDILTYGRNYTYRLFDIYYSILLLLTGFGMVVYHWRSYFFGIIRLRPNKSKHHTHG